MYVDHVPFVSRLWVMIMMYMYVYTIKGHLGCVLDIWKYIYQKTTKVYLNLTAGLYRRL